MTLKKLYLLFPLFLHTLKNSFSQFRLAFFFRLSVDLLQRVRYRLGNPFLLSSIVRVSTHCQTLVPKSIRRELLALSISGKSSETFCFLVSRRLTLFFCCDAILLPHSIRLWILFSFDDSLALTTSQITFELFDLQLSNKLFSLENLKVSSQTVIETFFWMFCSRESLRETNWNSN